MRRHSGLGGVEISETALMHGVAQPADAGQQSVRAVGQAVAMLQSSSPLPIANWHIARFLLRRLPSGICETTLVA